MLAKYLRSIRQKLIWGRPVCSPAPWLAVRDWVWRCVLIVSYQGHRAALPPGLVPLLSHVSLLSCGPPGERPQTHPSYCFWDHCRSWLSKASRFVLLYKCFALFQLEVKEQRWRQHLASFSCLWIKHLGLGFYILSTDFRFIFRRLVTSVTARLCSSCLLCQTCLRVESESMEDKTLQTDGQRRSQKFKYYYGKEKNESEECQNEASKRNFKLNATWGR